MSEALYVEILKRYIFNIISYVRNLWCKAFNFLNSTMNNDKLGKTPIHGQWRRWGVKMNWPCSVTVLYNGTT